RRFPVTSLLRILGLSTDTEIQGYFAKSKIAKEHASETIKATLAHDTAKTPDEAYVEIYRRLRDGDIATTDAARDHVQSILSGERYDLSKVGRFHFNRRFELPLDEKHLSQATLALEDVARIVMHIAAQNADPRAEGDDIDHLGFRRVRFV